jgi:hypothetical protein
MESKSLDQVLLEKISKAERDRQALENDSPRDFEQKKILDTYILNLKEELCQFLAKNRKRRNSNIVPLLKLTEATKGDPNGDTPR